MKAIDFVLLLFFINLGIGAATASMALYGSEEPIGITPSGAESGVGGSPRNYEIGGIEIPIPNLFADTNALMWAMIGAIAGAALIPMVGSNIMRAIPIVIFGVVFWWMWGITYGILNTIFPPGMTWFITVITLIYAAVFFIGMLQFVSGRSTGAFE